MVTLFPIREGDEGQMAFKPRYTLTNTTVKNLTKIAAAREIIMNAYLVPKWDVGLRREALLKSAHSSTAIEGNPLTLEEVTRLAEGREVTATRKAKKEVLNYLHALENLDAFEGAIARKTILKLHKWLTTETLENPKDCGVYRNMQVVVGNRATGEIVYTPPPAGEVPALMDGLVKWLSTPEATELDPVLEAGITHYEFVRIHPFVDGNGRAARVLATLILYKRGFDTKRFFVLDDYYDSDRNSYYEALREVDEAEGDLTKWLEYFTEGVAVSVSGVKDRILELSGGKVKLERKGQVALTERQMKIVEAIHARGRITNRELQEMFEITPQAVHKALLKLVGLGVIKQEGKGRGAHYILA